MRVEKQELFSLINLQEQVAFVGVMTRFACSFSAEIVQLTTIACEVEW